MPSFGNASSWREYRDKGNFSRRECERIDAINRRIDRLCKRIQEAVQYPELARPGLAFDRRELEALDWALEIVLNSSIEDESPLETERNS